MNLSAYTGTLEFIFAESAKASRILKWYAPQKLDTFGGAYFYGKERTKI